MYQLLGISIPESISSASIFISIAHHLNQEFSLVFRFTENGKLLYLFQLNRIA